MNVELANAGYPYLAASGFDTTQMSSAYEGAAQHARWGDIEDFGPNDAVTSASHTLRSRSHHYIRNNPWARHAVRSWASAAVGTGIRPQWSDTANGIDDFWEDWTLEADFDERHDFYGLQALVCKTVVASGECFVIRRPQPKSAGLTVPLQLQVLEPDFLANDVPDQKYKNGTVVKGGIRFDKHGKREAYRLFKSHPKEDTEYPEGVWVPASEVLHIFEADRPGQSHGVGWASSCLLRMHELDQYEDAELVRKKTAALFSAFIYEPPQGGNAPIGVQMNKKTKPKMRGLSPASMQTVPSGYDIKFSNPADVGYTYEPWLRNQLLGIARAYGLTYEMLTGDLRQVNYSSIRAGMLEFRRLCEQVQQQIIVFQFSQKVVRWFLDLAYLSNAISMPGYSENKRPYLRVKWQAPRWEEVDPLKASMSDYLDIRNGLSTQTDCLGRRGTGMDEYIKTRKDELKAMDDADIWVDTDPRRVAKNGAQQQQMMEEATRDE